MFALSWVLSACAVPEAGPVQDGEAAGYAAVHVEKSTPVVRSWKDLRSGDPVARLAASEREWIDHALVQRIAFQTGVWDVRLEEGHTVFRIYPYMSNREAEHPPYYQGIVIKVDVPRMSAEDLVRAIRRNEKGPALVEFSVFGKDADRYSPKLK